MYGVGRNPVYLARVEERAATKALSGEAAREQEDAQRAAQVAAIFQDVAERIEDATAASGEARPQTCETGGALEAAPCLDVGTHSGMVDALFANPYMLYGDGDDDGSSDEPPLGFGDGCDADGDVCI